MAVIGNRAATNYQTIRKQTITGTGATSYSLDYSVSSPNDLEVFVNNVRQEPTTAYTASGQTITFTAAVNSTDSVYIIYQGQTVGSVVHPSDQPLGATTGTFSGAVSGTDGTFTGNVGIGASSLLNSNYAMEIRRDSGNSGLVLHTAGSGGRVGYLTNNRSGTFDIGHATTGGGLISFSTSSSGSETLTERMRIDSAGRVTMPYQPAFFVTQTSLGTSAAGSTVAFNYVFLNVGSHFSTSTNRFTAPIDGVYHFYFYSFLENDNTVSSEVQLYKNGGSISIRNYTSDMASSYGPPVTFQATLNLIANDYMTVYTGLRLHANLGSYFGGYLIG